MLKKSIYLIMTAICCMMFASCGVWGGMKKNEPSGIVSTSVSICNILDRLGCDNVVGVPDTTSLPERYSVVKKVGAAMSPDMEILSQINPEYIFTPKTLESTLGVQYENAGLNAYFADLSSVEGMYDSIDYMGELIGKSEEARILRNEYTEYMKNYATQECNQNVLILMCYPGGFYLVATEDSYVGNLVKLAGAKNVYGSGYVTDGSGVASVSPEDMIQKNPDKIFVFAHYNEKSAFEKMRKDFTENETWQNYAAVRNNEIYYLSAGDGFGMSANLDWTKALDFLNPIFYGAQNG